MNPFIIITAELLVFVVCGIVLGLCAVSRKVILIAVPIIFAKGIIWDAYFLGRVYLLSVVMGVFCVMYLTLGWALYYKKGKILASQRGKAE